MAGLGRGTRHSKKLLEFFNEEARTAPVGQWKSISSFGPRLKMKALDVVGSRYETLPPKAAADRTESYTRRAPAILVLRGEKE